MDGSPVTRAPLTRVPGPFNPFLSDTSGGTDDLTLRRASLKSVTFQASNLVVLITPHDAEEEQASIAYHRMVYNILAGF